MDGLFEFIDAIDKSIVMFVQTDLQFILITPFMQFITNSRNWIIPALVIIVLSLWKGGKKGRLFILLLIPMFFLSDYVNAKIIKPFIDRPRPFGHGGWSMPSVHSANSFAVATMAFMIFFHTKKAMIVLYSISSLIAISRVYIGVHYPSDIIMGALIGICDSLLVIAVYNLFKKFYKNDLLPVISPSLKEKFRKR